MTKAENEWEKSKNIYIVTKFKNVYAYVIGDIAIFP